MNNSSGNGSHSSKFINSSSSTLCMFQNQFTCYSGCWAQVGNKSTKMIVILDKTFPSSELGLSHIMLFRIPAGILHIYSIYCNCRLQYVCTCVGGSVCHQYVSQHINHEYPISSKLEDGRLHVDTYPILQTKEMIPTGRNLIRSLINIEDIRVPCVHTTHISHDIHVQVIQYSNNL